MNYEKIKLGLIGKVKVWKARREAEKARAWRDKIEHEISEVDYTEAEKLEEELLEQKRTKKATRDAKRLYKKTYGKNNDGIGEQDFIEDYLVENGLKQKALPEPESNKKHNFMDKYPTEKSEEEKVYEQENKRKIMYYEIEGKKYEVPFIFSNEYLEKAKDDDKTLSTEDGTNYTINIKEMTPEDRNRTLKRMIELSLNQIGQEAYMTAEINSNTPLKQSFPELTRKASYNDYIVKKLYTEGKVEEANSRLEKMVEKILQFYKEMSENEQEETR